MLLKLNTYIAGNKHLIKRYNVENIKPFTGDFQMLMRGSHVNCYLAPTEDYYTVVYDPMLTSRNNNIPLLVESDTIMVDEHESKIASNDEHNYFAIPISEGTTIHNNANNRMLESYRNGMFNKQKIHNKFVESLKYTERFKQFLSKNEVDLTIISSQTLTLVGVLFYEFANGNTNLAHQICMDPFHYVYDVAVIVK